MQLITLQKKLSNIMYRLLGVHKYLPSTDTHPLFTKSNFVIITIAFNNLDIIKIQHDYLIKHFKDPFDHVIADNSNDPEASQKLERFCAEKNISYVKIPWNILTGIRASGSHGVALNWCYHNVIKKYCPKYFGFLDHDILPLRPVAIFDKIRGGFYGIIRDKKAPYWYFWPGFCFFEYEPFKNAHFDFFPYHTGSDGMTFLDTGGSNYHMICRHLDRSRLGEASHFLVDMNTGRRWVSGSDTRNTFELVNNDWLHIRQISWREESMSKLNAYQEIITLAQKFSDATPQ